MASKLIQRAPVAGQVRRSPGGPESAAPTAAVPATPESAGPGEAIRWMHRAYGNRAVARAMATGPAAPAAPPGSPGLRLGPRGDRFEREAERLAHQVAVGTGRPAPVEARSRSGPAGPGGDAVDPAVQRAIQRERNGGRPIPAPVRSPMEQALGADLATVRLHTGARADALNRVLQADAFTVGRDVFFRHGGDHLGGRAGREVLAHELTHVVQHDPGVRTEGRTGGNADGATVRRTNRITTTDTDRVHQPLWVLHKAFGADFTAAGIPESYTFNGKQYDPANPDTLLTRGVLNWKKPNRPKHVTATLDGVHPGGPRNSQPPQSLYGHLGMMERAIFGRPLHGKAIYEGGHFVSDEILGQHSYTEHNFAPQDDQFNAPLWRLYEDMARVGPYDAAGTRAAQWTYRVRVQYPHDYHRTAQQLEQAGVLDATVAAVNPGRVVTFPRRVPDRWEADLNGPANHEFPQKTIGANTHAYGYYNGTANAVLAAAVARQGSGIVDLGMDSLALQTSAAGTAKVYGGVQNDLFAAVQYFPRDLAKQAARTVTGPGGVVLPPLLPQPRPNLLTKKASLRTAVHDADSDDRDRIAAAYPAIAAYVWKEALPWAFKQCATIRPLSPLLVLQKAMNWTKSGTKKKTVTQPQKLLLSELSKEGKLRL